MSTDGKTLVDLSVGVAPGTQLNGIYEIDERIAMGGMGEVYRGHNIQTGDVVAIKIVLPEFAKDETILALFRKEASVLNHLSHDSIVRYHVFTVDPGVGRPYLAMEFVDGQSVADRMLEGPMDVNETRKMVAGVASGLNAAHEAGVIHRDLSPDNIILVEQNGKKRAKIIDFGIAKAAGVGGGTLLGGKFAGKYNFVSPEQLGLFDSNVTERSDIYSLGLVFAAALAGEAIDMSGSQVEVIEKRRVVPDISWVDPLVQPIINAMLQPDPSDRPESMAVVGDWLFPPETSHTTDVRSIPPGGTTSNVASDATVIMPSSMPPQSASQPPAYHPPSQVGSLPSGSNPFGGAPQPGPDGLTDERSFVQHYSPAEQTPAPVVKKSNGGLIAGLLVVLLAAVGGGAYTTGMLDGIIGPNKEPIIVDPVAPPVNPSKISPTTPPVKPIVDKKPTIRPLNRAVAMVDWLNKFDGGPCFYASTMDISEKSIQIEGFATNVAMLEKLDTDFQAKHDMEPDIQARLIDKEQCAVVEFLQSVRFNKIIKPTLSLSSTNVSSGQPLKGKLAKIKDGVVSLLLIDNAGVVYNLENFLVVKGDTASFNIKLIDLETRDPLPQLILALSSRKKIAEIQTAEPELASALLGRIQKAVDRGDLEIGAVTKYFKLGG
jgi:serine/threonine protein kinase